MSNPPAFKKACYSNTSLRIYISFLFDGKPDKNWEKYCARILFERMNIKSVGVPRCGGKLCHLLQRSLHPPFAFSRIETRIFFPCIETQRIFAVARNHSLHQRGCQYKTRRSKTNKDPKQRTYQTEFIRITFKI